MRRPLALALSFCLIAGSAGVFPAGALAQSRGEPVRLSGLNGAAMLPVWTGATAVQSPTAGLPLLTLPILPATLGTDPGPLSLARAVPADAKASSRVIRVGVRAPAIRSSVPVSQLKRVASAAPVETVLRNLPPMEGLGASEARETGDGVMDAVLAQRKAASDAALVPVDTAGMGALSGRPGSFRSPATADSTLRSPIAAARLSPIRRTLDSFRLSRGGARWAVALGVGAVYASLIAGLAAGPATPAFLMYKGALVFWSVLGSITLHEAAHAWTAEKVGDVSARMAGQVSANPWRYMSPGSATMLLVTSLFGFPFGFFFTVMQASLLKPRHKWAMA